MPARNEDWILGFSLRALLRWVDGCVVLAHRCTDRTVDILREVQRETGRVTFIEDSNPTWREMEHRQRLLDQARAMRATHVATVDADEVLAAHLTDYVRKQIDCLPAGSYMGLSWRQAWGSASQYVIDAPSRHGTHSVNWAHTSATIAFADAPKLGWKPRPSDGYDHHHREPYNARVGIMVEPDDNSGLIHFQFADRRRLIAKHAAYKITERIRWPQKPIAEIETLYNLAIYPNTVTTTAIPAEWLDGYGDIIQHLRLGEVPWQEEWCRAMVEQHGPKMFEGLDLFGVAG